MSRVQEQDAVDLAQSASSMSKSRSDLDRRRFSRARSAPRGSAPARWRSAPGPRWPGGDGAGRAAEHGDQPAARFRPERRAEHLFLGSGRHRGRSVASTAWRSRTRPIQRLWTGALWAEGPAWNAEGTLPGLERHPEQPADALDRGRRPRDRVPHAVEQQQRQHLRLPGPADLLRASRPGASSATSSTARSRCSPTRSRASGSTRPTTPSRIRTAASGSPTRPTAGSSTKARPMPPAGRATRRASSTTGSASRSASAMRSSELPTQVYRWDPSGRLDVVIPDDKVPNPNGLCFSPDYKKLYVVSTARPGDTAGGKGDIHVLDVGSDNKLSNQKVFTDCMVDGVQCGPDGMRCRRLRQSVELEQRRPQRRLQRRHRVEPGGQAARPHPDPRDVRQRLLRRPQAQPAVHGRQPVALRRLHRHPGRGAGLIHSSS